MLLWAGPGVQHYYLRGSDLITHWFIVQDVALTLNWDVKQETRTPLALTLKTVIKALGMFLSMIYEWLQGGELVAFI